MKKDLKTKFSKRQYMLSKDFEIYYYSDRYLGKVESHMHTYYELYFFLEGNVSILIDQTLYPLKTGDVVVLPPGIFHKAVIHDQEQAYTRFVFWISVEYYQKLEKMSQDYAYLFHCAKDKRQYIFHNDLVQFSSIRSRIFPLIEELHAERFGRDSMVFISVCELFLHLNRMAYEQNHPKRRREEQTLYQNLLQHIEEHLEQDLSLEHLAKTFFVSKYHIAHIFKENTGISIHQYIMKKRLAACQEAILSNISIAEAYLLFGFRDYSSFYRAFKKEFGISPKEYRDMKIQVHAEKREKI